MASPPPGKLTTAGAAVEEAAEAIVKGKKKRDWRLIAGTAEKKLVAALLAKFDKDHRLASLPAEERRAAREAMWEALEKLDVKKGSKALDAARASLQSAGVSEENAKRILGVVEKYVFGNAPGTRHARELLLQTRAIKARVMRVPEMFRLPIPEIEGASLRRALAAYEKPGLARAAVEEAGARTVRVGKVAARSRPVKVAAAAGVLLAIASMAIDEGDRLLSELSEWASSGKQQVVPKPASEEERMSHLATRAYAARAEVEKLGKRVDVLEALFEQAEFGKLAESFSGLQAEVEALVDDATMQAGATADEIGAMVDGVEAKAGEVARQVEAFEKKAEARRQVAGIRMEELVVVVERPIVLGQFVYDEGMARSRLASLREGVVSRDAYLEELHMRKGGNYCSEFLSNAFDMVYGPGASVALGMRGKDAWHLDEELFVHGAYELPAGTPVERIPEGAIVRFRIQGSRYQAQAGDEPTHAGMYVGGGKFVHMIGAKVTVENLSEYAATGGHMELADIIVPPKEVLPETPRETRVVVRTLAKGESLLSLVVGMADEGIIDRAQVSFYMSQAWRHNAGVLSKRRTDVQLSFEVPVDLQQATAPTRGRKPWVLDCEEVAFESEKPTSVAVDRRKNNREEKNDGNQYKFEVDEATAVAINDLEEATDFEKHVLLAIATKERGGGKKRAYAKEVGDAIQDVVGSHALVRRYGAFQIDFRVAKEYYREVEKKDVTDDEAEKILGDAGASARVALWNLRRGERFLWVVGRYTGETLSKEQAIIALAMFHNGASSGVIGAMQQMALRRVSKKMDEAGIRAIDGTRAFEMHHRIAKREQIEASGYLPVSGTAKDWNGELAEDLLWLAAAAETNDKEGRVPKVGVRNNDVEVFREVNKAFSTRGNGRTAFFTTRVYSVMDRLHVAYCGKRIGLPTERDLAGEGIEGIADYGREAIQIYRQLTGMKSLALGGESETGSSTKN